MKEVKGISSGASGDRAEFLIMGAPDFRTIGMQKKKPTSHLIE